MSIFKSNVDIKEIRKVTTYQYKDKKLQDKIRDQLINVIHTSLN